MGRLLRLNAHQATFEHCKFQLSAFIAVFLFAWLLTVVEFCQGASEDEQFNFKINGGEHEGLNMVHYTMLQASWNILVVSIAAYAVQFRLPWLMLPWLVSGAANIAIIWSIFADKLLDLGFGETKAFCVFAAIAFYLIGHTAYGLYLGVVSFCELGAANRATAPYILIELER